MTMTVWNLNDKLRASLKAQIETDKKIINKGIADKNQALVKIYEENIIKMKNALEFGILVGGSKDEGLYLRGF
jgi:hypothetical protein